MDDELFKRRAGNYEDIAMRRGMILNNMTMLEAFLNKFLAAYFTADDFRAYDDFLRTIISSDAMTFGRKIQVFRELGYWERAEFGGKYRQLPSLLAKLNEKRNVIAHGFQEHATEPVLRKASRQQAEKLDAKFLQEFAADYEKALSLVEGLMGGLLAEVEARRKAKR